MNCTKMHLFSDTVQSTNIHIFYELFTVIGCFSSLFHTHHKNIVCVRNLPSSSEELTEVIKLKGNSIAL